MKFNLDIIKLVSLLLLVCTLILFIFLWYKSNNQLKVTKDKLSNAQATISSLKLDNENLVQYNLEKENQLKKIEEEYQETLNNIPSDSCGDVKPSKELLQFFRKNK